MKKQTRFKFFANVFLLTVCIGTVGFPFDARALEPLSPPIPQTILPVTNFTRLDPNQVWLEPSATEVLPIGARVAHVDPEALISGAVLSDDLTLANPNYWAVQKLTDHTYAIFFDFYTATLYVGDEGALLVDCGGHFGPLEVNSLLAAIASVTDKPLKALVYSHPHPDHVGNSIVLKQMIPDLEIIASYFAKRAIESYDLPIAPPTHVVFLRNGGFWFDGQWFRMMTPVYSAHTDADSYIITPDRVMHVVDFFQPMRLPFPDVALSQNLDGVVKMLRHLAGEADNYDYINVGHAQIAYQEDVQWALDYWHDVFQAWSDVMSQDVPLGVAHYLTPQDNNAAVWYRNFLDDVALKMYQRLIPEWGHVRHFEVARDHTAQAAKNLWINHFNAVDQNGYTNLPDLTPIPPPWPYSW